MADQAEHPHLRAYFEGLAESARATEGLYQMAGRVLSEEEDPHEAVDPWGKPL